jgi:hypothetical protein
VTNAIQATKMDFQPYKPNVAERYPAGDEGTWGEAEF